MEAALKAVAIEVFGSPEGLAVIDLPDPAPADGQVLIGTEAIGVGGVDAMILSGAYAAYGFTEGHVLGGEIAGTVAAVGDGVDASWIGRRVWAFTGVGGGYAEQAIAPAETLIPLPAGMPAVDAVTLGSSGAVAHFGLRHAHFAPGESVLVRGAAGGIGIMTVQLAARGGASAVAVTTSSADRGDRLRKLGATHVLDRAGEGGEDAPAGYDVIIDIVAGPDLPSFFAKLKPNGRMVAVGALAGSPPADFGYEDVHGVPEVDVVRDLQRGHRDRIRPARRDRRAVRCREPRRAAQRGPRGAALGAGQACPPEDGGR